MRLKDMKSYTLPDRNILPLCTLEMKKEYLTYTSVGLYHEEELIEIFRKLSIMKFKVGVSSRMLAIPEDGHRESGQKLADFEIRNSLALRKICRPCSWNQRDRSLTEIDKLSW